jgi:hypothetical protein
VDGKWDEVQVSYNSPTGQKCDLLSFSFQLSTSNQHKAFIDLSDIAVTMKEPRNRPEGRYKAGGKYKVG